MTSEHLIKVFIRYEGILVFADAKRQDTSKSLDYEEMMRHAKWCCQTAIEFAEKGKLDKAFRWLGFIQGVLCAHGIYTIDELRAHNTDG